MVVAAAGLIHFPKIAHFTPGSWPYDGYDLRCLWIGGKLWAAGQNAYGPAFAAEYQMAFGPVPPGQFLNYPPFWFPLAAPLSLLSFQMACIVWRLFSFGMLLTATALTARLFAKKVRAHFWTIFLAGVGFATVMQPASFAFNLCQTSMLIFFGLAAIFYGISRRNQWALLSGLIVVALKPNIGVVVYVLVATMPEWRRTLVSAVAILMLAATPVLLWDPSDSLSGFFANLGHYYGFRFPADEWHGIAASDWLRLQGGDWASGWVHIRGPDWIEFVANSPVSMTGLFHFTDALPRGLASGVLNTAAAIASIVVWRRSGGANEPRFARIALVVLLLVPLHVYDLVMLTIPAIFVLSRGTDPRMLPAWAGLLMCFRPGNITDLLGITPGFILRSQGPLVATVGLFLVAIAFLIPASENETGPVSSSARLA